ncbi:MAG TPA: peptidylprolyl isomerase [Candidatus Dormibacteraeota bacterium]|jgi:cyclophilin family peptidyl-prolyl cis-trans isomerase
MKRWLLLAALGLVAAACGGDTSSGDSGSSAAPPAPAASYAPGCQNEIKTCMEQRTSPPPQTIDAAKTYVATVHTSRGDFAIQLDPRAAPVTVNNFVFLAQNHFYDGLTFHRYVPGFVIQGGDPAGNGTGGLGYKLPNETNPSSWPAGSLGMASNAAGVSGCQFFVVLAPAPSLATSGVYNHFGAVHSGMDVVQQLRQGDTIKGIDVAAS